LPKLLWKQKGITKICFKGKVTIRDKNKLTRNGRRKTQVVYIKA